MAQSYLPPYATISEACEWLQSETGKPWTLARLIEHGLMPWFWLDYQAGWPDEVFKGTTQGYLAPMCFAGDQGRLMADGRDVLVTMTRTYDGKFIKLGPPPAPTFSIDELRFKRDEITRLASKFAAPDAPACKVEAVPDTTPGDDWKDKARMIADECFVHDTKCGCRDSLATKNARNIITGGYAFRVMVKMQERDIKGPRGIIDNPATIMREALQGKK